MDKLYRVVFPTPNNKDTKRVFALQKSDFGVIMTRTARKTYQFERDRTLLTKDEICKDFQWVWDAGIPVEEVD